MDNVSGEMSGAYFSVESIDLVSELTITFLLFFIHSVSLLSVCPILTVILPFPSLSTWCYRSYLLIRLGWPTSLSWESSFLMGDDPIQLR